MRAISASQPSSLMAARRDPDDCLVSDSELSTDTVRTSHGTRRREKGWGFQMDHDTSRASPEDETPTAVRAEVRRPPGTSGWSLDFLQGSVEVEHRRPASSKVEYRASPEDDLLYFTRTKDHPTLRTSGLLGTGLPLLPVLCVPGHDPTSERIYTGHHRMESSPQRAGIARVGLVEGFSTGSVRHTTVITL